LLKTNFITAAIYEFSGMLAELHIDGFGIHPVFGGSMVGFIDS
jgi:hypothetical protein